MDEITRGEFDRLEKRVETHKAEIDGLDRRVSKHEGECYMKRKASDQFQAEAKLRMSNLDDTLRRHAHTSNQSVQRIESGFAEMRGEVKGRDRLITVMVAIATLVGILTQVASLLK